MTTEFDAAYFDGLDSTRHPVRVSAQDGQLRVAGESVAFDVPVGDVRVEAPVAGARHHLELPGGGQLCTDDAPAIAALFGPRLAGGWLRRLEARWHFALGAFLLIAAGATWFVFWGMPILAERAAKHVPEEASNMLGEQVLVFFDRGFCRPSKLEDAEQERIRRGPLRRATQGLENWGRYYAQFRDCRGLGANAFALPDGTLLVTDAMVKLAQGDEELAAIFAHEIGHVHHRHGLRIALQAAGLTVLLTGVTADAVTITSLAPLLPVLLLQSGYSRAFEEEADGFALQRLREIGIPASRFATVLERLEESHRARTGRETEDDYLSTHPATKRRIERARSQ